MWWMVVALAKSPCAVELASALPTTEASVRAGALDRASLRALDEQLACHRTALSPELAARVHEVLGRHYGHEGDVARAAGHWVAAWGADPFRRPPDDLDPTVLRAYERGREAQTPWSASVERLASGVRVDGRRSTWRLRDLPALVQAEGGGVARIDAGRGVPKKLP